MAVGTDSITTKSLTPGPSPRERGGSYLGALFLSDAMI